MHDCHPEQVGECHCHRVIRSITEDAAVWGVEVRDDILEWCRTPGVARVVSLPAFRPFLVGGNVAAERTAEQAFLILVLVFLDRDDKALEGDDFRSDNIVVCFHLVLGNLIRIGIIHLEPADAGGGH